jgi:signal transduction histidine kinase
MGRTKADGDQLFAEQMAGQLSRIRFWGALAFLCVAAVFAYGFGEHGSRAVLPGLAIYCAAALLLRDGMKQRSLRRALTVLWPFYDVGFVVLLRLSTLRYESAPGTTVAWTVAILTLIVMLAALSLGRRFGLLVAAFAFVGAAAMLHAGGVITSLIVASGVALFLANETASWAARLLDRAAELDDARRQLEVQHRELVTTQKQAEDLIAFLVHDMRNPLTAATALLECVERRTTDAQTHADLSMVFEQHRRLLGMFEYMLAVARLEQGAMTLQRHPTRMSELLSKVAEHHAAYCSTLNIEMKSEAHPGLWAEIDMHLVYRAVENLVSNALSKAGPGARVHLEARSLDGEVAIAVRNTGSKIPAGVRPRLFEKFASDGREHVHAGLGLYFCRLVAEAHRGSIELEESPQWPVSFVMRLPSESPRA